MKFSQLPVISKIRQPIIFKLLISYSFLFIVCLAHLISSVKTDDFPLDFLIFIIAIVIIASFSLLFFFCCSRPFQILIPTLFIITVILFDLLVIEILILPMEKMQMGLFLLAIYFILHEKINKFHSLFSIIFLIVYMTFKTFNLNQDTVSVLCNFFLVIAQTLNIFIPKSKKKTPIPQTPKHDLMQHVFDVAFPGLVFLFKKKANSPLKTEEKSDFELSFINQKAQIAYNIKSMNDFVNFLDDIIFLKDQIKSHGEFGLSSSNSLRRSFKEEIFKNLKEVLKSAEENVTFLPENNLMGFFLRKNLKLRVFVTGFLQDENMEGLLFIDDNQFEEDYCALKELDEKKDKMLIAITHDLRSPLNGILAFINLAKNEFNRENRNNKLNLAEINGNLLMSLIEDILDFQSIAQNKFSLKSEEFNLNAILEEIVALISLQTQEKKITFQLNTNFPKSQPFIVFSDSRRLKQILLNLLTNSIKFTMNGGKVRLNVLCTTQPNIIKFEIIDSGIGIKPEIIEKLGEPFNTFDTNGLNKYGIGFGLYLCKKLSGLLGPKNKNFHISSIYGKGSKIGFLIYTKLLDLEKQTISHKRLYFQQVSDSVNTKGGNEIDKLLKTPSKNSSSNSKIEWLKKSQFSKQIFSVGDFDLLNDHNIERMFSGKASKVMTEIHLHKDDNDSRNNLNLISTKPTTKTLELQKNISLNHDNYDPLNLKNRSIAWGLTRQVSHLGSSRKMKRSIEEIGRSKKEIIISDETLDFSPFSEDELTKKIVYEEIDEVEEFSDEGMLNVETLKQYSFEAKSTLRKLNTLGSAQLRMKKKQKLRVSHSIEASSLSRHFVQVCNVLIVDDNTFNLLVLFEFLKKIPNFNVNIEKASNGAECLKMFKSNNIVHGENNYNIIFMDCYMPIMDGYQTATEIKRLIKEENYVEVIIIAVTGLSGLDEENKCTQSGMDDFLMKPVLEKELTEVFMFYMSEFMTDSRT